MNRQLFRLVILISVLVELVSFAGHDLPLVSTTGFFLVCALAFILSWQHLEYGVWFLVVDLVLGSKSGHIFSASFMNFAVSLRMGLFAVVMSIWFLRFLQGKYKTEFQVVKPILQRWGIFFGAVVFGVVVGLLRHNAFKIIFSDANAYMYGLLILPVLGSIKKDHMKDVVAVIAASLSVLAGETLFFVYFFSHGNSNWVLANMRPLYRWIRDAGIGEVTTMQGGFARVFFQSHIYLVIAFFVLLAQYGLDSLKTLWKTKYIWLLATLAGIIIATFSRSFWISVVVLIMALGIIMARRNTIKNSVRFAKTIFVSFTLGIMILFVAVRFPIPLPTNIGLGDLLEERLTDFDEAALQSRWNLLRPLWQGIQDHPVLGSGFGKTITYTTEDPRARAINPSGQFTTYAFEWGYLDIWLKMGIIGLAGYGILLWYLMRELWSTKKSMPDIGRAALAGMAVLVIVHFFTPYLNHPLGIGFLIAISCCVKICNRPAIV